MGLLLQSLVKMNQNDIDLLISKVPENQICALCGLVIINVPHTWENELCRWCLDQQQDDTEVFHSGL